MGKINLCWYKLLNLVVNKLLPCPLTRYNAAFVVMLPIDNFYYIHLFKTFWTLVNILLDNLNILVSGSPCVTPHTSTANLGSILRSRDISSMGTRRAGSYRQAYLTGACCLMNCCVDSNCLWRLICWIYVGWHCQIDSRLWKGQAFRWPTVVTTCARWRTWHWCDYCHVSASSICIPKAFFFCWCFSCRKRSERRSVGTIRFWARHDSKLEYYKVQQRSL